MHIMKKAKMAAAVVMVFSLMGSAQAAGQSTGSAQTSGQSGQSAGSAPQTVKDVETLLDDVARYNGQKVQVSGEVEKIIDPKAFVLESGGLFNDEIVVLQPQGKLNVKDDSEVTVTGTVRTVGLVDVEREYGWDLDPQIRIELERVEAFLIADRIESKKGS